MPIQTITHNFFERGHSQNEGDHVHSVIERSTKAVDIFEPQQWKFAVKMAKRTEPKYKVVNLTNDRFLNFKQLSKATIQNRSKDQDGMRLK
jgi:hypothetical protein